jgi:hypothetical protein
LETLSFLLRLLWLLQPAEPLVSEHQFPDTHGIIGIAGGAGTADEKTASIKMAKIVIAWL